MISKLSYNNRILTPDERVEYCKISEHYINDFSEYINGLYQLAKDPLLSNNSASSQINNTIIKTSLFIQYSFCDCAVFNKLFVRATNPYEKSMLRGKLKVLLNESFKKLYGFNKKGYKDSYCAQLEAIMPMFPGFKNEFDELLSDLAQISKDSWWKDERNAEVHIDAVRLYELRHEEINESKVVMETSQLIACFNRFNNLMRNLSKASLDYTVSVLKKRGVLHIDEC